LREVCDELQDEAADFASFAKLFAFYSSAF
jgi:hypothetical protein